MTEGSEVRVRILAKLLGVGCTPSTNTQSFSVRHHGTSGEASLPFPFPSYKIATVLLNPGHYTIPTFSSIYSYWYTSCFLLRACLMNFIIYTSKLLILQTMLLQLLEECLQGCVSKISLMLMAIARVYGTYGMFWSLPWVYCVHYST